MSISGVMNRNRLTHCARIFSALCLIGIFVWWMSFASISRYSPERDRADIIRVFKQDQYFLSTDPHYPVEYMLDTRSSDTSVLHRGNLQLYVLRKQGAFVGFTAFHKMRSDLGRILFVAVDRNFRNSGYGRQLTQFAMRQLLGEGAHHIILTTRVENFSAQRIYETCGFKLSGQDKGIVYYQYDV